MLFILISTISSFGILEIQKSHITAKELTRVDLRKRCSDFEYFFHCIILAEFFVKIVVIVALNVHLVKIEESNGWQNTR